MTPARTQFEKNEAQSSFRVLDQDGAQVLQRNGDQAEKGSGFSE